MSNVDYDSADACDEGFATPEYREHATRRVREYERGGQRIMAQHWRDCRALSWGERYGTKTHRRSVS